MEGSSAVAVEERESIVPVLSGCSYALMLASWTGSDHSPASSHTVCALTQYMPGLVTMVPFKFGQHWNTELSVKVYRLCFFVT